MNRPTTLTGRGRPFADQPGDRNGHLASLIALTQIGAMMLLLALPALVSACAERIRRASTDERGDAGGKGLIILISTVIGIGVLIAIGVLIKAQIDKRSPGLDQ